MKKPSVVVFDLGKVLVDFDYSIAVRRIGERCKIDSKDLVRVVTTEAELLYQYEIGALTTDDFFREVQRTAGFEGKQEELATMFADIFSPIDLMIEVNERLRAQGIPTYIFSNTNPLAANHIRERFPFFRNFTDYVLSYEHKAMKPQEKIYQVVEKISGASGDAILYLDDREENIEGGAKRGWQTILHSDPHKSRARMAELKLL